MVTVKFLHSYIASRGYGYNGVKGAEKQYEMNDGLKDLIDRNIVEVVKSTPAQRRTKATKKVNEKS